MIYRLSCKCGSDFSITKGVVNRYEDICCPSCGKNLPVDATDKIKKMFRNFIDLEELLKDSNFKEVIETEK